MAWIYLLLASIGGDWMGRRPQAHRRIYRARAIASGRRRHTCQLRACCPGGQTDPRRNGILCFHRYWYRSYGVLGILLFDEPAGMMRLLSLAAIVAGVGGLKLFRDSKANDAISSSG